MSFKCLRCSTAGERCIATSDRAALCDICVAQLEEAVRGMVRGEFRVEGAVPQPAIARCRFCGKDEHQGGGVLASGKVAICGGCLSIMRTILDHEAARIVTAGDDRPGEVVLLSEITDAAPPA